MCVGLSVYACSCSFVCCAWFVFAFVLMLGYVLLCVDAWLCLFVCMSVENIQRKGEKEGMMFPLLNLPI